MQITNDLRSNKIITTTKKLESLQNFLQNLNLKFQGCNMARTQDNENPCQKTTLVRFKGIYTTQQNTNVLPILQFHGVSFVYQGTQVVRPCDDRIFNGALTLDLPFGEKEVSLACFSQVKWESQIFASDHKKIHNPKVRQAIKLKRKITRH